MQRNLFLLFLCLPAPLPSMAVVVAPGPAGEELSGDYQVVVDGQRVPVYRCRVSAVPLNQVWPGYQRPIDQTELASFAYWDMDGPVRVQIEASRSLKTVAVRPSSLGIRPAVDGRRISFNLPRPAQCSVEVDGTHYALHLFANPPEKNPPKPGDPGVRYFGPGVHRPGKIELESNQTVYIAAGAVVHGHISVTNARNVRILGRGILDASTFEREAFSGMIRLAGCRDAVADGIVLRDANNWTVIPGNCQDVKINNLKLIGMWRYNSDGIDVVNSQDVIITGCFVRSFDDSIVIKGLKGYEQQPVRNVTVSGCVIWNDWNKAIVIGPETCAPNISDLLFRDMDIIRASDGAMAVHCGDQAEIRNVRFENIRLEIDPNPLRPRLQAQRDERYVPATQDSFCPWLLLVVVNKTRYSRSKELGSIRGVHLRDILISGPCMPGRYIRPSKPPHDIQEVTIEKVHFNGKPAQVSTRPTR